MGDELRDRLDTAIVLALEAADSTLAYFQSDLLVEHKSDGSPVTVADRAAEELLRQGLARACPDDTVIGEEFGETVGTSGYAWFLDPIDGTQSFIRGVPLYGTMIGIERESETVAGVIVFPALREIIFAAKGLGAHYAVQIPSGAKGPRGLGTRRARVSSVQDVRNASLSCTSPRSWEDAGLGKQHHALQNAVRMTRGYGDCYGHYLVATGRLDIMVDARMYPWDNAPLLPIIVESGGRFTDMTGKATIHSSTAISTNGLVHERVLEILRG